MTRVEKKRKENDLINNIYNIYNIDYQVEEKSKEYILRGIPADLWQAVKIIAARKNTTIRNIILNLLLKYVEENAGDHLTLNVTLGIQAKQDLLRFAVEEDIRMLLKALEEACKRGAPRDYILDLKRQVIDNIKKCPDLDLTLAEEIRRVFKLVADKI